MFIKLKDLRLKFTVCVSRYAPKICILAFSICFYEAASAGAVNEKSDSLSIKLSAPANSEDGAFVIRLALGNKLSSSNQHYIQLWRRQGNEDYELVTSQRNIVGVAQSLNRAGQYTYQARVVTTINGEQEIAAVSNDQVVQVSLRYPMLSAISSDF